MSSSNRPPSRPSSRTPSIPIPGARSIEDILNINTLDSSSGASRGGSEPRSAQGNSRIAAARSLYSGIEATRPAATRHASTSSSVGSSRPALLGGSGPSWGVRTVSASTGPVLPGDFGMQSALSSFEPRVIGGSGAASTERNGAPDRQDSQIAMSPTRRVGRISTQGGRPPPAARDIPIRSHSNRTAPIASAITSPHAHQLGNGAPTAFRRPSYLQYSSLHEFLQTDTEPPPTVSQRPALSLPTGRDATPFSESDDDSESSNGFTRRPYTRRERGRARERQNAYQASLPLLNADRMIHLPTRWNDQDKHKHLHVSEDGRNLSFHGKSMNLQNCMLVSVVSKKKCRAEYTR